MKEKDKETSFLRVKLAIVQGDDYAYYLEEFKVLQKIKLSAMSETLKKEKFKQFYWELYKLTNLMKDPLLIQVWKLDIKKEKIIINLMDLNFIVE